MAVKDPKKIELAQKRHEVAEDIVAIRNLKKFSQTKKDELIKGLLTEKSTTKYEQYLLNKPNMTVDDKANIEKIIESLKEKKMLTDKNFKKLETINYDSNYIEI